MAWIWLFHSAMPHVQRPISLKRMILDTNVISELARANPEPKVLAWLLTQPATSLATTTITIAEIQAGIALLPEGKKRNEVQARMLQGLQVLAANTLAFDAAAAAVYGPLVAKRARQGQPLRGFDGLIAAIALSRGQAIATRNVADFDHCGLHVVNPWE